MKKTIYPKEPIFNFNEWMNFIREQVNKTKITKA
jgi:hypothetical protein